MRAGLHAAAIAAVFCGTAAAQSGGMSAALSAPSRASAARLAEGTGSLNALGASATLMVDSIELVAEVGVDAPIYLIKLGAYYGVGELAGVGLSLMLTPHYAGLLAVRAIVKAVKQPGGYSFSVEGREIAFVPDEENRAMFHHSKRN